jgi:hypothetical protein
VLGILLLLSIAFLIFQYKPVQTWAAKKAAAYLSKKLKTKVSIGGLYIEPFSSVAIDSLYVLDRQKDTILDAPKLRVALSGFSLISSIRKRTIDFKQIELDNASIYLKNGKDDKSNLQFILDYFSSPDTSKTPGKPWNLIFEKTVLNNMHFRYKNMTVDTFMRQINFDDVDLTHLSLTVRNMDLIHHYFKGNVTNLTLHEKSGFYIKRLDADATVDSNQILAKNLFLQTEKSSIKNYFRMKFKSFGDFDEVENKVYMEGDFHESKISSSDISYFTDGLDHVRFDLGVDGRIKGKVNDINAQNLLVTGGKATYIKGDFRLHGLPHWNNTFLDLNFRELATNKADLDFLYSNFTGTRNRHIPDFLAKFGNINFTGRVTGLQRDFVTVGTFKTRLGRLDPDINLKTSKSGTLSYSGKIGLTAFDMGELTGSDDLGRATLTANFNGSGGDLKTLNANISTAIKELSFKGYDYQNINLTGSFIKKLATAKISINDQNLKLNLNGTVDLNAALPAYNITAGITTAHLHTLKLLPDTVTFSTNLTANFSGNDLANLSGNITLRGSRLTDPRNDLPIDSLIVSSTGTGDNRLISLKSDIADANLKGSFDLATLPDYFKSIAKKYIPALQTTINPPKPQEFSITLTVKDADPVIQMFVPNLKIPDQGELFGEFNSEKHQADLNAYFKTIKLDKIVFHDLIIDESAAEDSLGFNISLNKINLTDSLFIKDITLANVVKNNNLNFNVKLSDQNAVNSLDLYGLVKFGKDTTASLHLLPSDVNLEHQDWRLRQQVNVRLLKGKTEIEGFELSNGQQKVRIDGFISPDPADVLKLTFDKFSMFNLNQLTKPEGINLKGILNGDVKFTSITATPGIDALLGIDSLTMNKTLVGNVKIESDLGNDRKQANVKVNIHNHGLETMNIAGMYQLAADNLDFNVKMNQTEAIVFEPFIKSLVSNIQGTISTDLKLSGTPKKPQLNGNIFLKNTGVTVNYLQTPYTINDTLNVTNSVVNLNKMVIHDNKKGVGVVSGKIDLNDLANPDIEADVDAKNLLALNTKFKNNHLYYGTAFATGKFSFHGPIDNMNIDIKTKTEAGTTFNIPLNTNATVSENDFIKFVKRDDTTRQSLVNTNAFNGVTLNFDLTVDEKTTVKITTDYGVIEGNGQANGLKLNINSLGDFEMFGDFLISSGKFEFTAKNFISKNFSINQGGTIRWTGNPSNATINLNAVYEVRTDIEPLYQAAGSQSPKGHALDLVQADLILTKSLLQPTIDFDFTFPLDPSVKDDLSNYLSDENNRSQQAISIIVRRQFSNGANDNLTNQVLLTAGEALTEFAFNKLNSLISESNIKNFDLNIRSFNDASATIKIQDRFSMTGSLFDTYTNSSNNPNDLFENSSNFFNSDFNQLTKDFEAQYLIRANGDLSAKYSYRVLNSTTLSSLKDGGLDQQYVNGIGFTYQRDFDTFGEFMRNLFKPHNKKQIPIKQTAPVPATSTAPATAPPPPATSKPR